MRDRDDRAVSELLLNELLDPLLGDDVDVGGGFVQDNDLVLAEDGPADANELPLARAQVSAAFRDLEVDASTLFLGFLASPPRSVELVGRLHAGHLRLVLKFFLVAARLLGLSVEQVGKASLDQ